MKTSLLFLIFFLIAASCLADKDTSWLNNHWQQCLKNNAVYYSITAKKDSLWQQQMFFAKTGRLFMTGFFKDPRCTIKSGTFKWYFENGVMSDSITYYNNNPRYLCHYHTNGTKKTILTYNNVNRATYVNSWNPDGTEKYMDTFYHDKQHNECHKDTAWLKGIIRLEDSSWHLRFYYISNNKLYINSWYRQRLCVNRIKDFERYNEDGKLVDSILYHDNGKKKAAWLFHNNCMISAYKKYDSLGVLIGGSYWDEAGNQSVINPDIIYPSQPEGFKAWKQKLIAQINNDKSIDPSIKENYYGNIQVKLVISKEGKLVTSFIAHPSAYPAFDRLIQNVCNQYTQWRPGTIRGIKSDFVLNCNFFFTAGVVTGYQQIAY